MKKTYQLCPSILSADFSHLGEDLQALRDAGCEWVHIDVMDGAFVPQISFGQPVIASARKVSDLFFDVHLMVEEPGRMIDSFRESGADLLCVHAEACRHLDRTLAAIHDAGMKTGVALNPATPLSALDYVLDKTDMVLLMSVNPGYGGQSYIPVITQKIRDLREKLDSAGYPDISIEIDGGVSAKNAEEILEAGASVLVAGSAVFRGDIRENARAMLGIIRRYGA